ncbi:MAG: radical SAM protein [Candidatus Paceibacterota bacterium]|jgi:uncharacterized protein
MINKNIAIQKKLQNWFLIEDEKLSCYLVYSPLQMVFFAVNKIGADIFLQLKRGNILPGSDKILEMIEKNSKRILSTLDFNRNPHANITICPTFRCQLRCLYCFAMGGERQNDLSIDAAKAAIDLVLHRYSSQEVKTSRLTWHGGGEPTLSWQMLKKISLYHRKTAIELGIKPQLSIVSNGIWSEEKRTWIIKNFDRVTISCDGPPDIQNKQRPLSNGLPSSLLVYKTLRALSYYKVNFGIRATITENNVTRMSEMVQLFYDLCKPRTLQFERLSICGRCEESKIQSGSADDYINYFKEAFKKAKNLKINLGCSGVRIFRRTKYYCGIGGHTICVTPEGLLTTCHRVDHFSHPLANKFIFGKWDGIQFKWSEDQLGKLQKKLLVDNFAKCQNCFCKYTCAGGCVAAKFYEINSIARQDLDEHCKIIRELTKFRLISVAKDRGILKNIKTRKEAFCHGYGSSR